MRPAPPRPPAISPSGLRLERRRSKTRKRSEPQSCPRSRCPGSGTAATESGRGAARPPPRGKAREGAGAGARLCAHAGEFRLQLRQPPVLLRVGSPPGLGRPGQGQLLLLGRHRRLCRRACARAREAGAEPRGGPLFPLSPRPTGRSASLCTCEHGYGEGTACAGGQLSARARARACACVRARAAASIPARTAHSACTWAVRRLTSSCFTCAPASPNSRCCSSCVRARTAPYGAASRGIRCAHGPAPRPPRLQFLKKPSALPVPPGERGPGGALQASHRDDDSRVMKQRLGKWLFIADVQMSSRAVALSMAAPETMRNGTGKERVPTCARSFSVSSRAAAAMASGDNAASVFTSVRSSSGGVGGGGGAGGCGIERLRCDQICVVCAEGDTARTNHLGVGATPRRSRTSIVLRPVSGGRV